MLRCVLCNHSWWKDKKSYSSCLYDLTLMAHPPVRDAWESNYFEKKSLDVLYAVWFLVDLSIIMSDGMQ